MPYGSITLAEAAEAEEGTGEGEESNVDSGLTLMADGELAVAGEPG